MTRIFAPGLDGVGLADAVEAVADVFQLGDALDVGLQAFATCARPRAADGVGRRHDHRLHGLRLHLAVMAGDAVDHYFVDAVALGDLGADNGVRAVDLVADGLADVVQQAAQARDSHIGMQFSWRSCRQMCAVSMAW